MKSFLKRLGSFLRPTPPEPPQEVQLGLTIEGIEVFAVEDVPTGAVKFWAADHPLNPTDENIIVCDLATYVSLLASQDSQRLAALMVREALRVLRLRQRASERREQRKQKRAVAVSAE